METTKSTNHVIDVAVAVLLILLLATVAVIKLTDRDIYGVNATLFQTLRIALYIAGVVFAIAALVTGIAARVSGRSGSRDSLSYGLLAVACLCMVFVQAFSIAGEFENQGKTLQDAMYAVVYLMLAAILYIMSAMEAKPIFRVIVICFGLILFLAAMATDYSYLMEKAGRITGETKSITACALYCDEIVVALIGVAAVVHEVLNLVKNKNGLN